MPITKGDMVQVISGANKGKRARVLRVHLKTGRVTLEGLNMVKRHLRATTPNGQSGIVERPAPIHHSNMMLIDPKTGEPTRVRRKRDQDGTVERIAVKSGQSIVRNR
ncbi:MAG: 50S ribosomal protein L24 [Gemmatimonadetes bacterium]|nr:50S ribosomal protein L24 [Gemmatimonadota bacterium]